MARTQIIIHLAISILFCIFMFSSSGCQESGPCIRGNKELMKENRSLPSFNGLVSQGSFDVTIIEAEVTEVWIEAESNLLPYISTRVKQDDLVISIRDNVCLNSNLGIQVHVYTPVIERIRLEGSGKIDGSVLTGRLVSATVSGSGGIRNASGILLCQH